MYIDITPIRPITVDDEPLEFVEDFTYLGILISKDSGAKKDTKARLVVREPGDETLPPPRGILGTYIEDITLRRKDMNFIFQW